MELVRLIPTPDKDPITVVAIIPIRAPKTASSRKSDRSGPSYRSIRSTSTRRTSSEERNTTTKREKKRRQCNNRQAKYANFSPDGQARDGNEQIAFTVPPARMDVSRSSPDGQAKHDNKHVSSALSTAQWHGSGCCPCEHAITHLKGSIPLWWTPTASRCHRPFTRGGIGVDLISTCSRRVGRIARLPAR